MNFNAKNFIMQIIPGDSASLWKSVKVSKDVNITNLLASMYENEIEITKTKLLG
jgi:hypothetical protein